jgi:Kelch motif
VARELGRHWWVEWLHDEHGRKIQSRDRHLDGGCASARFEGRILPGLIGTTIVAAGGLVDPNPTGTGDNEGYNASSGVWTSLQADPTARGGACAGVIGTQLYVAGGYSNGPAVVVTESFNLSRNFWKTLAPMPQATSWGGSAVYGGKLYCFGSTDGYSGPLLLQIYQP